MSEARRAPVLNRWAWGIRVVLAVACALLLWSLGPPGAREVGAQPAPRPRYEIELRLDLDRAAADVRQRVVFPNHTGHSLPNLVFHITAAHYGAFDLVEASVDGRPVAVDLDGIVLEVTLPEPLAPGETADLFLSYSLAIPQPGNLRFGASQGVIALGNWYPVLAVFREGALTYGGRLPIGWGKHQQGTPAQLAAGLEVGDPFFTDLADYVVTIDLSRPAIVAHSGERRGPADSYGRYELFAMGVRDFALAVSERYETLSEQVGPTRVTAFFLPEHRAGGRQYLSSAASSLAWFNRVLGQYPYSTLHVAETISHDAAWVGQEYPQVMFIGSQITAGPVGVESYLNYLVVHEVLHQWFYALVGNDQLYEPWVDETLTTHISYRFLQEQDAALGRATWARLAERRQQEARVWPDRPVNTSIYDYDNETHYFAIVYRKGAAFLEEVRSAIGDEAYLAAVRSYADRYRGGFATGLDLLAELEAAMGEPFRTLAARYFSYSEYLAPPVATATAAPTLTPTRAPTPLATATPTPTTGEAAPSPIVDSATASPGESATATSVLAATRVGSTPPPPAPAATPEPSPTRATTAAVEMDWPAAAPAAALAGAVALVLAGLAWSRRRS